MGGAIPKMAVPLHRRSGAVFFNSGGPAHGGDVEEGEIEGAGAGEKRYLCKYFVKNACIRGANCTFSHDLSRFPCKLFHVKNNCKRRACPFSHAPIGAAELELLRAGDGAADAADGFLSPFLVAEGEARRARQA